MGGNIVTLWLTNTYLKEKVTIRTFSQYVSVPTQCIEIAKVTTAKLDLVKPCFDDSPIQIDFGAVPIVSRYDKHLS